MNDQANTPKGITPEVGKRYVTRGGWITPPWKEYFAYYGSLGLVSEYVEPTVPPDTFRRDLIARLYVGIVTQTIAAVLISGEQIDAMGNGILTQACIEAADTLIKAMEAEV